MSFLLLELDDDDASLTSSIEMVPFNTDDDSEDQQFTLARYF